MGKRAWFIAIWIAVKDGLWLEKCGEALFEWWRLVDLGVLRRIVLGVWPLLEAFCPMVVILLLAESPCRREGTGCLCTAVKAFMVLQTGVFTGIFSGFFSGLYRNLPSEVLVCSLAIRAAVEADSIVKGWRHHGGHRKGVGTQVSEQRRRADSVE